MIMWSQENSSWKDSAGEGKYQKCVGASGDRVEIKKDKSSTYMYGYIKYISYSRNIT